MEVKMDLHSLTYEEMCQMELMHAAGATVSNLNNAAKGQQTAATTTTTLMPIMVIPTAIMPTGTTHLITAAAASSANAPNTPLNANCAFEFDEQQQQQTPAPTHFYRLQPTHILTAAPGSNTDFTLGSAQSAALLLQPTIPTPTIDCDEQHQHQHQHQQLPQQIPTQAVNILYAGKLTKSVEPTLLARKSLECSTLPRNFQTSSGLATAVAICSAAAEESDFEGSECGTGVNTTTCMPHFRFGGCSMILQSTQQQHQTGEPHQVIGCAALGHIMGSFAAAAGDVMHNSGRGLVDSLGRHRQRYNQTAVQMPKRVSFKDVDLSPPTAEEELQILDTSNLNFQAGIPPPPPPPSSLQQLYSPHTMNAFNNCSYMHFNNFMDYQTTGFGGLPDVTEHSNIRRSLSRQNSTSNSDSGGEIASIQQKSKVNFVDTKSSTSSVLGEAETQLDGSFKVKRKKPKTIHQNVNSMPERNKTLGRGSFVVGLTLFAALCLLAVAAILLYQHFVMTPSRNSHAQRLSIVSRILHDVPLVDGHNNFAWNVRKYAHSSLELVHVSNDLNHKSMWIRPAWAQTDMERLKMGQVGVQVWSAFVPCEAQGLDAVQLALEQIDIIRRLADMYNQDTVLVTSSKDVQVAQRHGLIASLIGIEGGHAIGSSLGVLRSFYSLGARYLSLTHKCDVSWAGSSSSTLDAGLSSFGKAIVREMNRLGMMIDLSYSSDTTARDVLQATRAPVIFSHSGARQLCNSTRNIPDDILRLVAENGGLVMISFDSEDVTCGRQAHLRDVIDHIKYVRAIAGIQHIGLGAGYDSIEYPPMGLEDVSKYPDLLAALLEDVTWSEDDVAMLAGKNFLRIMETVENVRDYWKRANIDPIEQTETQPKTQCTYMSS